MGPRKLGVLSLASVAAAHSRHFAKRALPFDGTIWTTCTVPGTVALTFDDGPHIYTQSILDMLNASGHKVTFFQNGQNYGSIYDYASLLQAMIAGGHQIGSHTWSHADLATLTVDEIKSQMGELEAAHLAIIGKAPTYMRPPYLSLNDQAIATLKELGFYIISVDIDTQDFAEAPLGQIQNSIDWYKGNQTAGGTISLNHDPVQATAETFVPAIIDYLNGKGLKSVTVGECFGDAPENWYRGGTPPASSSSVPPSSSSAPPSSSEPPASSSDKPATSSDMPPASSSDKPPASSSAPHGGSGSHPPTPSPTSGGGHGGHGGHGGKYSGHGDGLPAGPKCGGDTEPGHGPHAGHDALPPHGGGKGKVNSGKGSPSTGDWTGDKGGYGGSSNSTGSAKPTGAAGEKPGYYYNSASTLGASTLVLGAAAAFALLL